MDEQSSPIRPTPSGSPCFPARPPADILASTPARRGAEAPQPAPTPDPRPWRRRRRGAREHGATNRPSDPRPPGTKPAQPAQPTEGDRHPRDVATPRDHADSDQRRTHPGGGDMPPRRIAAWLAQPFAQQGSLRQPLATSILAAPSVSAAARFASPSLTEWTFKSRLAGHTYGAGLKSYLQWSWMLIEARCPGPDSSCETNETHHQRPSMEWRPVIRDNAGLLACRLCLHRWTLCRP